MPEQGSRSIRIRCDVDQALNFLGDVDALPLWTSFYKKRLGRQGDMVRFATPIGVSLTRVETEYGQCGGQVTITSDFGVRIEQAVLLIEPVECGSRSRVTLLITFPDHVPLERRRLMLGEIEYELVRLRARLENQPVLQAAQ